MCHLRHNSANTRFGHFKVENQDKGRKNSFCNSDTNLAPKNSYQTGIWLSNIISQGGHGGGWDRQRQHICCSRKIRQIMDGWAELCHTQNEMKSNWIKLFGLSIFIFPKNGPHQSFFYAPQKKKKNYLILPEKLFMTPSLDSHITAEPKSERYQLSQPNLT